MRLPGTIPNVGGMLHPLKALGWLATVTVLLVSLGALTIFLRRRRRD